MPRRNGAPSVKRPKNRRRISALSLLEKQLVSGVKPIKKQLGKTTPLLDADKARIAREVSRLKAKIIK
jgi:hypothetical protein